MTIILLDDDPITNIINQKVVSSFFPEDSIDVFTNPKQAISFIENMVNEKILLFLDLNMPVLNGWEVLAYLDAHERFDNIKVIIVSSTPTEGDKRRSYKHSRVKSFIIKPLTYPKVEKLKNDLLLQN
tara:strand:+ start:323 stop:703 length:381 start_codon:yes stop_codon:yes gene_type:complete